MLLIASKTFFGSSEGANVASSVTFTSKSACVLFHPAVDDPYDFEGKLLRSHVLV
jgi:predicted esterase